MKKSAFIILLISAIISGASYFYIKSMQMDDIRKMKISPDLLLNKDLTPQEPLSELLNIFEIKHDNTLKTIVTQTQPNWLRKAGTERWEMEEVILKDNDKYQKVMNCFMKLGMCQQIDEAQNKYEHVGILGATARRMIYRTTTAYKLFMKGTKFNNLVFFVGQRPRDESQESIESFIIPKDSKDLPVKQDWKFDGNMPNTELDLAKIIFDQIEWPKEFLDNVKVVFIDTPMQKNNDGSLRRPNTSDTIVQWLATNPKKGKCIFISNNPYVGYQDSVIRTLLPKEFSFETIGDAASKKEKISIYLDTLARWLYQEQIRLNANLGA